jgi:nucleoside-diphosphate-sugar epimerase
VRIAILGASGFIGGRTVEMLHLERAAEVRPVTRTAAGLAGAARFALDGRVADAFDAGALREALEGCEVVVHCVAGDRRTILGTLAPTVTAARAAGVRRLVYLSSASVHGQAPAAGTDERSPLRTRGQLPYNRAKILAERTLLGLRKRHAVEVVLLRPGIVYGPRSRWTIDLADDLLAGRAYLVGEGDGICNGIYVDNLVHAIRLAAAAPAAAVDGEAFLVGDREPITWTELYRPMARALGLDLADIPRVRPDLSLAAGPDWWDRVLVARDTTAGRAFLDFFPERLRFAVYSGLGAWHDFEHPSAAEDGAESRPPAPTLEMALLQSCRHRLPFAKARAVLGYEPPVAFEEACRRTVGWLAFAGYPVREDGGAPPR